MAGSADDDGWTEPEIPREQLLVTTEDLLVYARRVGLDDAVAALEAILEELRAADTKS